jgi:hypothetical protein
MGYGDRLAGGAASASFGPLKISKSKWEKIFGKLKKKRSKSKT